MIFRNPFGIFTVSFLFLLITLHIPVTAQVDSPEKFTHQDSLRGYLNKFRACYDVNYYNLDVKVDIPARNISGNNTIYFNTLSALQKIQVDLFENMSVDSVFWGNKRLSFKRDGNAFMVTFPQMIEAGKNTNIRIFYHGSPRISLRPPWDGGFVWEKDSLGRDWVGVACEGTGASLWWPCKDHLSDEPDSMCISVSAPGNLEAISNGRLIRREEEADNQIKWTWKVSYPINNYSITLNLAHYNHFNNNYISGDMDTLPLNYWVLDYNMGIAGTHFSQTGDMLKCFEHYLGKYPFPNDGYKLVETPYWGMEHQSCIAYGNDYENNEYGFDFIIIHESAHEYWGNSVSAKDHGEIWIHESFATYMESLYVEYFQGKKRARGYLDDLRKMIYNIRPISGPLHVNYNEWIDADMYYKGAWMLHSIRNTLDDDRAWFDLLKSTYEHFAYHNISGADLIGYMSEKSGFDLKPIFRQFLNTTDIPVLRVTMKKSLKGVKLKYRWTHTVKGFNMPVKVKHGQTDYVTLHPASRRKTIHLENAKLKDIEFSTELYYFKTEIR